MYNFVNKPIGLNKEFLPIEKENKRWKDKKLCPVYVTTQNMGESQVFTCDQLSTTSIAPGLTACNKACPIRAEKNYLKLWDQSHFHQ